jgi:hypothetical protein
MRTKDCPLCVRFLSSPFGDPDRECIHTCHSCGYHDKDVECSGVYFCPNPLCRMCGASWIADGLKKVDVPGTNGYTVDGNELHDKRVACVMSDAGHKAARIST